MVGYLKFKSNDEELYETDYLNELKQKNSKISKIQYFICHYFYRLLVHIKHYANIITVKEIYGTNLFILPFEEEKYKKKKIKKCMMKTQKLMKKYNIETIVISDELKKYEEFQNTMEAIGSKIHILNGRGIMPYLIKEIFEHITIKQGRKLELEDLYICVKENKKDYIDNITYLMHYFKTINIITPNINAFQKMADKIAQKESIIMTVTNNKKKSLKRAKLIVNLDFEDKEIQKYNIYRTAILITINEKGFYQNAGFDGIQIRQIGIDTSEEIKEMFRKYELLQECSLTTLYESLINEKHGFFEVKQQMEKDKIRVIKLYGKNGEIVEDEYMKLDI